MAAGIEWPEELRPLATLDGPAVVAANAALQHLLASFPKESARSCSHSAKAMEVFQLRGRRQRLEAHAALPRHEDAFSGKNHSS